MQQLPPDPNEDRELRDRKETSLRLRTALIFSSSIFPVPLISALHVAQAEDRVSPDDLRRLQMEIRSAPTEVSSKERLQAILQQLSVPSQDHSVDGEKGMLRAEVFNELMGIQTLVRQAASKQTGEKSSEQLKRYISQIKELPDTDESLSKLQQLRYPYPDFPGLSYSDQNNLHQFVAQRIAELAAGKIDRRCRPLVEKVSMPPGMGEATVIYPFEKLHFSRLICAAYAATGDVAVTQTSSESYAVRIKSVELKFQMGGLAADGKTFVPASAPIAKTETALQFESYSTPTTTDVPGTTAALVAFYSSFQQRLALLLRQ
jgi:hypothetical protein